MTSFSDYLLLRTQHNTRFQKYVCTQNSQVNCLITIIPFLKIESFTINLTEICAPMRTPNASNYVKSNCHFLSSSISRFS